MNKEQIINRIKTYKKLGSEKDLADFLGISPQNLGNWKRRGTLDFELILTKCADIDPNWLLYGKGDVSNDQLELSISEPKSEYTAIKLKPLIPIDAQAGSSSGSFQVKKSDVHHYYSIPEFANADFYIKVAGPSMIPKYYPGETLACQIIKDITFFQWGRVYVLDTENGAIVKRIKQSKDEDHLLLVSENPEYEPFSIPKADIFAYALVLGKIALE